MKKFRADSIIVLALNLLNLCTLSAQTCECDAMLIPVFTEDFSSGEIRTNVWDPDIQTHSRIWDDAPEQQYYVNEWHTWLNPQDLTDFSYSAEAGSDIVTMKAVKAPCNDYKDMK